MHDLHSAGASTCKMPGSRTASCSHTLIDSFDAALEVYRDNTLCSAICIGQRHLFGTRAASSNTLSKDSKLLTMALL